MLSKTRTPKRTKRKRTRNPSKKWAEGHLQITSKKPALRHEQDPFLKAEKEGLMKRVTCAYENNDLHSLLTLEMEWMKRTETNQNNEKSQSDE